MPEIQLLTPKAVPFCGPVPQNGGKKDAFDTSGDAKARPNDALFVPFS